MTTRQVGFYTPAIGYWEASVESEFSDAAILNVIKENGHPDAIIAPLKTLPGTDFDGKKWVDQVIPDSYYARSLDDLHNRVAAAKGYESRLSIATYVNSAVADWKKESEDFLTWRDQTTVKLVEVLAMKKNRPSVPDFLSSLPAAPWKYDK